MADGRPFYVLSMCFPRNAAENSVGILTADATGIDLDAGSNTEEKTALCAQICAQTAGCVAIDYDVAQDLCGPGFPVTDEGFAAGASIAADMNEATYTQRCCAGSCSDGNALPIGVSLAAVWGLDGSPFNMVMIILSAESETCSDGVTNQDETDIDCGGDVCDPCADGGACTVGADCASGSCFFASTDDTVGECSSNAVAGTPASCPAVAMVKRVVMNGRTYLVTTDGDGAGDFRFDGTTWYVMSEPTARGLATAGDCSQV